MRMRTLLGRATIVLGVAMFPGPDILIAHESEVRHIHVNGGMRPFDDVRLTWYQDIVYDDSAEDTALTSLDIYVPEPLEGMAPVLVYAHGGGSEAATRPILRNWIPNPGFLPMKWVTCSSASIIVSCLK